MGLPVWGSPRPTLTMSDAVAAIIRTPEGKFLMQLRDARPNIWYPASWGCFGGALNKGETSLTALRRELLEELELSFVKYEFVSRLEFDLRPMELGNYFREYYLVEPTGKELSRLVLHEGENLKEYSFDELAGIPLTPYDAFAIHLYWMRNKSILA